MTLGGLISAGEHRIVVGAADADPVGGVGGPDLADQGIAGLMVQFLKGRGFHRKAPIRGGGLDTAGLLGRDQKNDLAHRSSFAYFGGSTLAGNTRVGVQPGIRGSVIESPPAGMDDLPLAPLPQGWPPMAT
jgi:hypothetical protein